MKACLFPVTLKTLKTLMTFQVLDKFHEHHLASKKAAYNYIGSLQQLTDGAFTPDVAMSFFCFVTQDHFP